MVGLGKPVLKAAQESAQPESPDLNGLPFDGQADFHVAVTLATCRSEPFAESTRTGEQINDAEVEGKSGS